MPEIMGREIDQLPDSSFAVVLPGGTKDEDGLTRPRHLRLLPYRDGAGEVQEGMVYVALADLNSSRFNMLDRSGREAAWNQIVSAADEQVRKDAARYERPGFFPPPRKF